MVFSSVPVYLDSSNWQQQPNQQGAGNESPHLPAVPASNNHVAVGGGGTGSSTRPGSMADRARLANLPHPEAALKCPRCESTNTKFCYYNNYSLSQQRHFCKTCRRYWTKGGALRNVPVGGGCRRNRKSRSQSSSSKSPVSSERQAGSSSTSAIPSEIVGRLPQQTAHHHQLPFMTSLHHNLTRFGVANFGLNVSGVQGAIGQNEMGFQMGSNSGMSSSIGMQQFPSIEPASTGLYPFQGREGAEAVTSSSRVSQSAPVKMEGNQGLNIPIRPFLSIPDNNQYWGGNTWTDLSGLNSSSASHLL